MKTKSDVLKILKNVDSFLFFGIAVYIFNLKIISKRTVSLVDIFKIKQLPMLRGIRYLTNSGNIDPHGSLRSISKSERDKYLASLEVSGIERRLYLQIRQYLTPCPISHLQWIDVMNNLRICSYHSIRRLFEKRVSENHTCRKIRISFPLPEKSYIVYVYKYIHIEKVEQFNWDMITSDIIFFGVECIFEKTTENHWNREKLRKNMWNVLILILCT